MSESITSASPARPITPSRAPGSAPRRRAGQFAWVAAGVGAFAQSTFALFGDTLSMTYLSVFSFAVAATAHALSRGGARFAASYVSMIVLVTFTVEAIGVQTGFPFGEYAYTGSLGVDLFGVSLLIPLAWITLAYPAAIIAHILVGHGGRVRSLARILVAAVALTSWDVFLDTQMVEAGNWGWANPEPSLPGTPGIPLTNYAGWLLTAMIVAAGFELLWRRAIPLRGGALSPTPSEEPSPDNRDHTSIVRNGARGRFSTILVGTDAQPVAVYLWTYVTCVIGNLTFWDRPSVALAGGIAMGVIAIPLITVLLQRREEAMSWDHLERTAQVIR